ncbi:MAG: endonuclease/exonuclease/phosphatase [Chitinophagaceae bacterium]|nr:endonuclease/exonuclease/phosphatase [Chitinophagaceae bacterium]
MRTLLLLGILFFALKQNERRQVCIVAFYNLENFYDTVDNPLVNDDDFTPRGVKHYDTRIYRDKVNKLASVISLIGTDVVPEGSVLLGVAEIENDTVLNDLVHHPLLQPRHYRIIHFDSRDARGVDVALLYNPKYFVPEEAEKLFVQIPGNSKEAFYTRDILYVKGLLNGELIHIYVNHWPSRRGGEERSAPARDAAAAVCKKHADSILQKNTRAKLIIMGDLNDDPDSRSVTRILRARGDQQKLGPGDLFNPWLEPYLKGIGTLANRDSWGLFDQIILSPAWLPGHTGADSGLLYRHATIFARDFMKEDRGRYKGYPMRTWDGNTYRGGYSDHFPTFVTLEHIIRD